MPLVADFLVGVVPCGEGRDEAVVVDQWIVVSVVAAGLVEFLADALQFFARGAFFFLGQQELEEVATLVDRQFEETVHVVPAGWKLVYGVDAVAFETVDDGARFV